MFYDPMIAKLITWGKTRDIAADLQVAALDRFEIEGPGHNIDFLSALMQHPRFRSGELTTGFIAEEYPEGFHGAPADEERLRAIAAIAAGMAVGQRHPSEAAALRRRGRGRPHRQRRRPRQGHRLHARSRHASSPLAPVITRFAAKATGSIFPANPGAGRTTGMRGLPP